MKKGKILGIILIYISIILSLVNFSYADITGGVIGIKGNGSILTVFIFVFFFIGLGLLGGLEKKVWNAAKTIALVGGIAYGMHHLKKAEDRHYGKDAKEKTNIENVTSAKDSVSSRGNLNVFYPASTTHGRFQRTYRWDNVLDKTEEKYDIPEGILKGLAMQESYGDPLRLNEGDDGGAGLFMLMPGTAIELGLKVHDDAKSTGKDKGHGNELKELMSKNNYDYGKMAKIDERFDVNKAADAAARYLVKAYKKYNSWDKALSAYNRGPNNVAKNPLQTPHVQRVREFQEYYNKLDIEEVNTEKPKVDNKKRLFRRRNN